MATCLLISSPSKNLEVALDLTDAGHMLWSDTLDIPGQIVHNILSYEREEGERRERDETLWYSLLTLNPNQHSQICIFKATLSSLLSSDTVVNHLSLIFCSVLFLCSLRMKMMKMKRPSSTQITIHGFYLIFLVVAALRNRRVIDKVHNYKLIAKNSRTKSQ